MKKIMRWVPMVTVVLAILMWLGLHLATDGRGQVDNYSFVSSSNGFALRDILSMFGHSGNWHLITNLLVLMLYCTVGELLLGSRKFLVGIVTIMTAQVVIQEVIGDFFSLGASGWLSATPGLMLLGAILKVRETGESIECMTFPLVMYIPALVTGVWDIQNLNTDDGIGHAEHLIGQGIGLAFAVPAVVLSVITAIAEVRQWLRQRAHRKAWEKKHQAWAA